MTGEIDNGVKDIERVTVTPAEGDDDVIETEDTDPDSPQGNEGEEGDDELDTDPDDESPDGKPEALRHTQQGGTVPEPIATNDEQYPIKRIPGETPREFALRLELHTTRQQLRGDRKQELLGQTRAPAPVAPTHTPSPQAQEVLGKYKPEELAALREVMPLLAAEMGFVRKDEIQQTTYAEQTQGELDSFLEKHPEYSPEKDPDGTLWGMFTKEFQLYKQPTNPKDFRRLFEKVHQSVFGIQPSTGALPKVIAQQRKVQAASHAGASSSAAPSRQMRPGSGASSGLRLDMLQGFDDDTKNRIAQRAQG